MSGEGESGIDGQITAAIADALSANDKVIEIRPADNSSGMGLTRLLLLGAGAVALAYWVRNSQKPDELIGSVKEKATDQTQEVADRIEAGSETASERIEAGSETASERIEAGTETASERIEEGSERAGEAVQEAGETAAERTEEAGEEAADQAEESGEEAAEETDSDDGGFSGP